MKPKILIIEDEKALIKGLRLYFENEGFEVDWSCDGESGLKKALNSSPDLIILDIMLPRMNGLDICRQLRQMKINVPIIMLTAKGEEIDKVVGLEIGADDYMTKPFSIRELLARVKAHLRRKNRNVQEVPDVYVSRDVEIDFIHFKIRREGKEFDLTSLEKGILKYFIAHAGEVVTRENLLDKIWGYENFPTTRTIDNHILKLRKKIEKNPSQPKYILSVYGEGYRFQGE